MHEFSRFWMFCELHCILDKINNGKYDLSVEIKSLHLALFAYFGHQSMHQVLQGTLSYLSLPPIYSYCLVTILSVWIFMFKVYKNVDTQC